MSLSEKIRVEPLSDARVARIEGALFEKLDEKYAGQTPDPKNPWGSARTIAFALVALVAAALLFAGIELRRSALPSATAANPTRIVTGSSDSHLALGETSIDVSPNSALVVTGDEERGVLVVLDGGGVTCDVAPRHGRPPFVVQAGGVRVRVVGTHFRVTRDGDLARVHVYDGTVEVNSRGETAFLHRGETWPALKHPADTEWASPPPPSWPPTVSVDALAPSRMRAKASASVPAAVAMAGAQAPALLEPPGPSAEPSPEPAASAIEPLSTPQELFERAASLEARDPRAAIAIYRRLAAGEGAWAMNALFAQGSLEDTRGNHGEARRLLETYVARYPQGRNLADARALLGRLK
jgi:hypothetical protein